MRRSCSVVALALLLGTNCQAVLVVGYTSANGTSVVADGVGAAVTATDLVRGTGVTLNSGATFNTRNWTETAVLADAIANADYIEWGFTSTQPYDLTDVDVRYDRSGGGPSQIDLQVSINGTAFASVFPMLR